MSQREDVARIVAGRTIKAIDWQDVDWTADIRRTFALTLPDRGSIQFAADGSAFVEVTLHIPAEALK